MAVNSDDRFDEPLAVELLADLQAGLLDDRTAARLRYRARTDPDVARQLALLDSVRRDVADLGVDAASAPAVPAGVTARVAAALRGQLPPADRVLDRRGRVPAWRLRTVAAAVGLAAVVAAGAVGTTTLLRAAPPGPLAAEPTASSNPVAGRPPGGVALSDSEILALLTKPSDLGALADPRRRASCLGGLGYSTGTPVLGARPLAVMGRPGVLLLLPGDTPGRVDAVVVAPNCSSADTGVLASTVLDHS